MATLRELREKHFLSLGELAKKASLPRSTVYDLEKGKHKPIRRTIRKLAAALEVEPGEIEF
ncbi:MAG: helix-turn-helix transcriptional regulator [Dehalococcoidales bacterium]|nr:helix-turn-helix transcriptional regulator [Dehalococcoidales bacterium]